MLELVARRLRGGAWRTAPLLGSASAAESSSSSSSLSSKSKASPRSSSPWGGAPGASGARRSPASRNPVSRRHPGTDLPQRAGRDVGHGREHRHPKTPAIAPHGPVVLRGSSGERGGVPPSCARPAFLPPKNPAPAGDSTYCGAGGQLGRSHGTGGPDALPGPVPEPFLRGGRRDGFRGGGAAPQTSPGQGTAWRDPQAPHGGTNPALAAAEPSHKQTNAGPGCKRTLPHPPRAQRPCRAKPIPGSSEHPAEGAKLCSKAGKHRSMAHPLR